MIFNHGQEKIEPSLDKMMEESLTHKKAKEIFDETMAYLSLPTTPVDGVTKHMAEWLGTSEKTASRQIQRFELTDIVDKKEITKLDIGGIADDYNERVGILSNVRADVSSYVEIIKPIVERKYNAIKDNLPEFDAIDMKLYERKIDVAQAKSERKTVEFEYKTNIQTDLFLQNAAKLSPEASLRSAASYLGQIMPRDDAKKAYERFYFENTINRYGTDDARLAEVTGHTTAYIPKKIRSLGIDKSHADNYTA